MDQTYTWDHHFKIPWEDITLFNFKKYEKYDHDIIDMKLEKNILYIKRIFYYQLINIPFVTIDNILCVETIIVDNPNKIMNVISKGEIENNISLEEKTTYQKSGDMTCYHKHSTVHTDIFLLNRTIHAWIYKEWKKKTLHHIQLVDSFFLSKE